MIDSLRLAKSHSLHQISVRIQSLCKSHKSPQVYSIMNHSHLIICAPEKRKTTATKNRWYLDEKKKHEISVAISIWFNQWPCHVLFLSLYLSTYCLFYYKTIRLWIKTTTTTTTMWYCENWYLATFGKNRIRSNQHQHRHHRIAWLDYKYRLCVWFGRSNGWPLYWVDEHRRCLLYNNKSSSATVNGTEYAIVAIATLA